MGIGFWKRDREKYMYTYIHYGTDTQKQRRDTLKDTHTDTYIAIHAYVHTVDQK